MLTITQCYFLQDKISPIVKTVAERVRSLRKRMNLTQEQMGEKLCIGKSMVYQVESGAKELGKSSLRLLELMEESPLYKGDASISETQLVMSGPRLIMHRARLAKELSFRDLSRKTGYSVGVLQAVEEGGGHASEKLIEAICNVLDLDKEVLMGGSDHPPVKGGGGLLTHGVKPDIVVPPGMHARTVPVISFARAGTLDAAFTDIYEYDAVVAINAPDRRTFGVRIQGDSMMPKYSEGDVVVVSPSKTPRNGDLVIAHLDEESGGNVMCKIFSTRESGQKVILSSYNPVYLPMEYERRQFSWIFRAIQVVTLLD